MSDYLDYGQATLYTGHSLGNGYSVLQGRYVIPLAEAEPTDDAELADWVPYAIVDVHAPIMTRTVSYDTTKRGGPPVVAAMEDAGGHEFLSGSMFIHNPRLNSDGWTHTWQVAGQYSYVVAGPVSAELENGLVTGASPVPMANRVVLNSQYGSQTLPTVGTIRSAGLDAKAAYAESHLIDVSNTYFYTNTALFPGAFFSPAVVKGETLNAGGGVPSALGQEAFFDAQGP